MADYEGPHEGGVDARVHYDEIAATTSISVTKQPPLPEAFDRAAYLLAEHHEVIAALENRLRPYMHEDPRLSAVRDDPADKMPPRLPDSDFTERVISHADTIATATVRLRTILDLLDA